MNSGFWGYGFRERLWTRQSVRLLRLREIQSGTARNPARFRASGAM